jgi:DNA-binding transcriptional LysR family regulator
VRIGNARDVMRWLGEAQIDVAQASDPPGDATFSYEPLFTSGLSCALPIAHHLTSLETVPIDALIDETLILREPGSKTRAFTERALADAEVEPASRLELQSRETIREGIALGLGVSVFFTCECPPDIRIAYRPLDTAGREYYLRGYLVCQSERRRSPLMRALQSIAADIRAVSTYR